MDAKSYSLLHTQLCGVTSTGHIAPWLRAQPEHTQHGHAQQAGARARTLRRQTARAHRAHSTGTQACAAPSAPVRGRPSHAHACVHWLLWAAATWAPCVCHCVALALAHSTGAQACAAASAPPQQQAHQRSRPPYARARAHRPPWAAATRAPRVVPPPAKCARSRAAAPATPPPAGAARTRAAHAARRAAAPARGPRAAAAAHRPPRCRPPCTVCLNVGKARPNPHRHRTRSSQPKYGGRIRAKSQNGEVAEFHGAMAAQPGG